MSDLHIEVTGAGPPLVLLHGWAMHGGVFAPLVDALRTTHTLHVVDLPGHGTSADSTVALALEPCVEAVLQQVPDAPWCGWSLGGLFALHAATTRPKRVPKLVMLCASPRFVREDPVPADVAARAAAVDTAAADTAVAGHAERWRYGVSAEIFEDFAKSLRTDYHATLERFIALEAFGSDHAREEIRALRDLLFTRGEPAASVLADGLQLLQTTDLRHVLPTLAVPSLWLGGRRDRLVDPRALQAASDLAPQSRAHVVDHAGHAPFLTHVDAVATELAGFIAEAP